MAPHIAHLTPSRSTRSQCPSTSSCMPHVFVVPPEEEQQENPPWCCFDADEQRVNNGSLPSNPDLHSLGILSPFQQVKHDVFASIARYTSSSQPRSRATLSRRLEKEQHPEGIKIIENKLSQARGGDPREDSDVIEVVKVKRCREFPMDLEENIGAKRSKTFRARATKALQSIKNVGKNPRRTHVKELWTSVESMPGIPSGVQEQFHAQQNHPGIIPTKKGSLSWNNSRSLSQIFLPMKASPPQSSFSLRVESPIAPPEADHPLPVANSPPLLHFTYNNTGPYPSLDELTNTLTIDDAVYRSSPLKPSMKRSINSKFSVRELHRLFSFSPQDESLSKPTTTLPYSSAASKSTVSVATSTLSSGYLDVPAEGDMHANTHLLGVANPDRAPVSRRISDVSFEMKLDSLRFDSLSFDPDDFDVSMEGHEDFPE